MVLSFECLNVNNISAYLVEYQEIHYRRICSILTPFQLVFVTKLKYFLKHGSLMFYGIHDILVYSKKTICILIFVMRYLSIFFVSYLCLQYNLTYPKWEGRHKGLLVLVEKHRLRNLSELLLTYPSLCLGKNNQPIF